MANRAVRRPVVLARLAVCVALLVPELAQGLCPPPEVHLNSRVTFSASQLQENTVAKYSCDPGFILIGEKTRLCGSDDVWTGKPPACVTNVAQGKPSAQSSTARGGPASNGNDGDRTSLHDGGKCTETHNETSPWWRVDLLEEYPVELVRVTTRGCCGQAPLQDVEIRVGNSETLRENRLCAWFPGTLEEGQEKDFTCARPLSGRYVYLQMLGTVGVLSVCEVQVFTAKEFAKEQCAPTIPLERLSLYDRVCYELQLAEGTNFQAARRSCQKAGGDLAHTLPDPAFHFLAGQLEQRRSQMKTPLLWIGVRKVPGTQTWSWVNGEMVEKPRWGKDQPNSYVGEQNCVVLDGGRDWKWNDFSCRIDYLHWVCEYRPQKCGSPDKKQNTTIVGDDFSVNRTIQYQCPEDSRYVGDKVRTCTSDGQWSGRAPSCQYVNCGPLTKPPEKGELTMMDDRTTYGARAQYSCEEKYALLGDHVRTCGDDGKWSGQQPKCLLAECPALEPAVGVSLQLRGNLTAGSEAVFSCAPGHKMIGPSTVTCQLGGAWSAPPPLCQLVDCGQPAAPAHGRAQLAGGTLLGDSALFRCDDQRLLHGAERSVCQEDGQWSEAPPACELIDCGEPDVPPNSYVTGYDFHVNSQVEYHCSDGHLRLGDANRTCLQDGSWSGEPPLCQYVDCGRTFTLLHGDVQYVSGKTHLGSELEYSCSRTYRLLGDRVRVCGEDGRWSGEAPACQEVRCGQPERPQNAVLNFSGNDGRRQRAKLILKNLPYIETFRVGARVTYKCRPGYKVVGRAVRSCLNTGGWSELPPSCEYVDCGTPESPASGRLTLPTRATHYGAIAEYSCGERYQLTGERRRICQGNGTWSGQLPVCTEVACSAPDRPAEVLSVTTTGHQVGDTATYHCGLGRRLVGTGSRTCQTSGDWSGAPPGCQWVDCGQVPPIANGRVYLVNQSTTFDSLVEHHCLPGHVRQGPFRRRCTETGHWSRPETTCRPEGEAAPPAVEAKEALSTAAGGDGSSGGSGPPADAAGYADEASARSITAAWTGAAVGVFLLMAALAGLFCFRTWSRAAKSAGDGHVMKSLEERRPPAAGLPGLTIYSMPADGQQAPIQTRPLPSRPDEEEIYAEADSFSSGSEFQTEPPAVYANRDATYANGLHHGGDAGGTCANGPESAGATYENGPGGGGATGAGGADGPAATNVNGVRPSGGQPPSGDRPGVTVNGMQMQV